MVAIFYFIISRLYEKGLMSVLVAKIIKSIQINDISCLRNSNRHTNNWPANNLTLNLQKWCTMYTIYGKFLTKITVSLQNLYFVMFKILFTPFMCPINKTYI